MNKLLDLINKHKLSNSVVITFLICFTLLIITMLGIAIWLFTIPQFGNGIGGFLIGLLPAISMRIKTWLNSSSKQPDQNKSKNYSSIGK